ncbi:MAG: response regulator transcription factor [Candidatus Kapaibacterium sp.]|jgi:two-component system invasion response regulator UvrY
MIRVLIADDHAIVREGLKQIVAQTSDILVIGEATSAADVTSKLRIAVPDLLLLDISMPGRSGLDVLIEVRRDYPTLPVLILSLHTEDQYALRTLKAGAAGYLTKESAPDQLIAAIRKAASGGKYLSPHLAEKIALYMVDDKGVLAHELLSNREFQVFRMIALGKTVTEIADELSLSVKTISTNRTRILEKMRMRTNAEITQYAMQNSLVDLTKG